MKSFLKKALVISAISLAPTAFAVDMTGAGATFPYPIYAKWAEAFKAKTGSNLNYQSIGSSGGIKQIKAKTVDFGATDNPIARRAGRQPLAVATLSDRDSGDSDRR